MTNKAFDTAANAASSREHFASRIGFILIAAGCAIGIGNVWRFPYITGEYGGGAFVLLYLVFLVILGLPVMVMEFAVGRASQKSAAQAFDILEPKRRFHWFSWWGYIGCMLLMMFYTTVAGWMLAYIPKMATGIFDGASTEVAGSVFNALLANPSELIGRMIAAIAIGFAVCSLGLQWRRGHRVLPYSRFQPHVRRRHGNVRRSGLCSYGSSILLPIFGYRRHGDLRLVYQ